MTETARLVPEPTRRRRSGRISVERINLSHGGGGKAMRDLIDDVFVSAFGESLGALEDQARMPLAALSRHGDRLAFTTDSYVVDPLFFPGGDIGELAINGTINDLAMCRCAAVVSFVRRDTGGRFSRERSAPHRPVDAARGAARRRERSHRGH